jgi:hypothetical protein
MIVRVQVMAEWPKVVAPRAIVASQKGFDDMVA